MFTHSVKYSTVILAFFSIAVQGADANKPARRYEVTEIVAPLNPKCEPGFAHATFTRRMNESGQIVGYHECWEPSGIAEAPFLRNSGRGYVWSAEADAQSLAAIGSDATGTFARAINESGTVVGWEWTPETIRALLWQPSTGGLSYAVEADLCPGFVSAIAEDINDNGSIAVRATAFAPDGCFTRWVLKRASGEEIYGPAGTLSSINNHELMAGSRGPSAIKWSPTLGEVRLGPAGQPRVRDAHAWNLNDRGQVIGQSRHFDETGQCIVRQDAVLWETDGTQRLLANSSGDTQGTALGINEHSLVVGRSESVPTCNAFSVERQRAVIWHKNRVTDLNALLKRRDAQKIQLTSASAITECGQIAAYGFYRDEPLQKCWDFGFDETTGEEFYDTSLTCRTIRAFLLTPSD